MASRREKYPETTTFHFHNANPKNRVTGDCWLRAICEALGEAYNDVLLEMVQVHVETGYEMSCDKAVDKYLGSKGWVKHKQPRKDDNTKYTGKEFCRWLTANDPTFKTGSVICNIGGHHMVAIKPVEHGMGKRYKVLDIWDCTDRCVGNYWTKG